MSAPDFEDAVSSCLEVIMPEGGFAVVLYHAYFDESGTHKDSTIMTVAGYVFESRQVKLFSKAWRKELDSFGLSAAHMTDCALGFGEYKALSMEQRIESEKRLIRLIRKRSLAGYVASVDDRLFNRIMGEHSVYSAYSTIILGCIQDLTKIVKRHAGVGSNPQIMYFFEAGHEKQSEANALMTELRPDFIRDELYAGHAFLKKKIAIPLQAADMLAWQHRHQFVRREKDGNAKMRADFDALIRDCDYCTHFGEPQIRQLLAGTIRHGLRKKV